VSVVSNELSTSYIYRRFNCLFSNKYTDPRTIVILDKYFYSSGSKGNIGLTPLFHITLFVEEHRDICCDFVLRPGDETRTERPKSFSSHLSVQQPNCWIVVAFHELPVLLAAGRKLTSVQNQNLTCSSLSKTHSFASCKRHWNAVNWSLCVLRPRFAAKECLRVIRCCNLSVIRTHVVQFRKNNRTSNGI